VFYEKLPFDSLFSTES